MSVVDFLQYVGGDATPAPAPLKILDVQQLQEQAAGIRWLVKHVIPADSVGIMFGGSGTFKSFIAIDAALHVAHGLPWLGRRTRQGPVLFIAAEGGAGLWRRVQAWHQARRLSWAKLPLFTIPVAVDLLADASRVAEAAHDAGITPLLVVVDTLSQTFNGEENSANEISSYLREIGLRFRSLWQCAVLVLHHSGHQATERPRGSSAIRANVDFMLGVFRDQQEMLATVECIKQKDGEPFDDAAFSLKSEHLGADEDGEAVRSLVASQVVDNEEVIEIMREEASKGRGGHNQLLLSLVQNAMQVDDLRRAFYADVDLRTVDAKRQAYHRALNWAKKHGYLDVAQGIVMVLSRQRERDNKGAKP